MRFLSLIAFIAVIAMATADSEPRPIFYNLDDAPQLFEKFIKDNDKHYKDAADRQHHYEAFVNNLKYINKENAKGHSWTLGITVFSDLTPEEWRNRFVHGYPTEQHLKLEKPTFKK